MKINKKRVWKTINIALLCVMWLFAGFVWGIRLSHMQPTIELKKGLLEYDEEIGLMQMGGYLPRKNHIIVSLSSDDFENTLLHEYGHYIYEAMEDEDRDYWDNELCNKSKKLESYKDSELCNEWFAIQFAIYIQGNYNIPEREFMNMVYGYYLK